MEMMIMDTLKSDISLTRQDEKSEKTRIYEHERISEALVAENTPVKDEETIDDGNDVDTDQDHISDMQQVAEDQDVVKKDVNDEEITQTEMREPSSEINDDYLPSTEKDCC